MQFLNRPPPCGAVKPMNGPRGTNAARVCYA
jgi:hypothetical protein